MDVHDDAVDCLFVNARLEPRSEATACRVRSLREKEDELQAIFDDTRRVQCCGRSMAVIPQDNIQVDSYGNRVNGQSWCGCYRDVPMKETSFFEKSKYWFSPGTAGRPLS